MNNKSNTFNTFHSLNKKELLFKIDETLEDIKKDNVRDILAKEMRRKMKKFKR